MVHCSAGGDVVLLDPMVLEATKRPLPTRPLTLFLGQNCDPVCLPFLSHTKNKNIISQIYPHLSDFKPWVFLIYFVKITLLDTLIFLLFFPYIVL